MRPQAIHTERPATAPSRRPHPPTPAAERRSLPPMRGRERRSPWEEAHETLGLLVDDVRRNAHNGPAGRFPPCLLALILSTIEVVHSPVDLDDQALTRPAEVGLLAGDPGI